MFRNDAVVFLLHLSKVTPAVEISTLALVLFEELLLSSRIVLISDILDFRRELFSYFSLVLLLHSAVFLAGSTASLVV